MSLPSPETARVRAARAGARPPRTSLNRVSAVPWYGRDTTTVQPLYRFGLTLDSVPAAVVQDESHSHQNPHPPLRPISPLQTLLSRSCVTTSSADDAELCSAQPRV